LSVRCAEASSRFANPARGTGFRGVRFRLRGLGEVITICNERRSRA